MAYYRGSEEDFNRFAAVTGDQGWSWNSLIPYMRKVLVKPVSFLVRNSEGYKSQNERWTPPSDHHNTAGQFNPAVHGFNGINAVSLNGFPSPVDSRIIETTTQLKEFPFNLDMNSGFPLGISA